MVCTESSGAAEISVRYTLTGLDAAGAQFVREFLSDARYAEFIEEMAGGVGRGVGQVLSCEACGQFEGVEPRP